MENSVSKAIEKAQQFSGYLELKEYQRQTIEKPIYLACRDVFVSSLSIGRVLNVEGLVS
jgi:hypothetical protein